MKKVIIIAAMALMSVAAMAQETKFAFVDFNEIVMLMPEMDEARATLEENSKTNEEILNPRLIHVNVWQKPLQYCKVIASN